MAIFKKDKLKAPLPIKPEHTVLLVDDEPDNLSLLASILGNRYRILLAKDGQEALELVRGMAHPEQLALVVSDQRMPRLTGVQLCEQLCTLAPSTVRIIVTGYIDIDAIVDSINRARIYRFVIKPFDRHDFELTVQRSVEAFEMKLELDDYVHNLEDKVEQRTLELQQRNDQLQATHQRLQTSNQALVASQEALRSSGRRAELIYKALNDALVGEVLEGKYRIDERLGSGGYGTVYRAVQVHLGNVVAIKVFKPVSGQEREEAIERFRSEGIFAFRVQHPNAVRVIDFVIYLDAIVFLVMEFVRGVSLQAEMAIHGRFSPARMAQLLAPVCDAWAAAHAAGVVHRDVKPGNILLQREGETETLKLIDFGIAKLLAGNGGHLENLTETGMVFGTPAYMAPERFLSSSYDGRSDVYSVGVLAYELLAGRRPFVQIGDDRMALALSHINDPPPELSGIGVQVSPGLQRLVMRALAKDPAQRPSAEALARELRAVVEADVAASANASVPEPVSRESGVTTELTAMGLSGIRRA